MDRVISFFGEEDIKIIIKIIIQIKERLGALIRGI